MEHVDNTLKVFLGCFIFQRTLAKGDVEDAVNVISETLILPKHFQDFLNCGKGMLCPA